MRFAPSTSPLGLLLASEHDDLESISTEELRHIHAYERQLLELTKAVGVGIAARLAAGKLIR